ncbi:hypothetical protein TRFO_42129 [Tritrichomonas foetus]|uniref:F5/8 type C domain-containing protein n=1 Tax=Tritrichomonas foetus TaxID=1144522 RepID=A0A1J4KXT7_9EUKA|nr:hypothetical protein TRFO_42129 [Tritrichomonas foetus]|eukprot:OHT15994.1 hypothetical protein TRFO_42129 [Tritrichomonas foetus]
MKANQPILLSSKGLARLVNAPHSDMINITVGPVTYPVDNHIACYISPLITRMILSDPLLDKFHFSDTEEDQFYLILDLISGRPVWINDDNVDFLIRAGQIFENEELVELCLRFINEPIKITNVLSKIIRKQELKVDFSAEIEFAASHLFEFDDEVLKQLDVKILRSLLGCRTLQIRNESWLFSFVCSLITRFGDEYRCLLGYIMFEALGDKEMAQFINMISPEEIDGILWQSLTNRLLKNVSNVSQSPRTTKCFSILSSETESYQYTTNSFDGVFANLSKKYGNLCEKEIVTISSSGNISMPPNEIIDNSFGGYWYSTNVQNSWVMIDFGTKLRIKPNAYSLRTAHFNPCIVEHLKSWVLEGSIDAKHWSELDRQKNSQDLNGDFKYKTWPCKELEAFRYIRLKQTSKNHHNSHFLFLNNIELFGTLIVEKTKKDQNLRNETKNNNDKKSDSEDSVDSDE